MTGALAWYNTLLGSGVPIGTPVSLGNASSVSTVSATTCGMTTVAAINAGDLVVVGVCTNTTNGPTATAVTDGSNTYTKATSSHPGATDTSLWYCSNCVARSSGITITATFSGVGGAGSQACIAAARVTGVAPVLALDQIAAGNTPTSTSTTQTTPTLTQVPEIAFGVGSDITGSGGTTYTGASGFTNITGAGMSINGVMFLDYKQLNATTAVTFTPVFGTSGLCSAGVGTFAGNPLPSIGAPVLLGTKLSATGDSTAVIVTSVAIQAGDFVAVAVGIGSSVFRTVTSVSDGTNTYTRATSVNTGAQATSELWYKENAAAVSSGASITITYSAAITGAGNQPGAVAVRVTGVRASGSLDTTATQAITTNTPSVTTATLAQSNEIAFGTSFSDTTFVSFTEASGFTNIASIGTLANTAMSYKIVSSTSAITYAPVFGSTGQTPTVIATFKGF